MRVLDTRQAAELTRLSRQTLAKWRVTGDGPPFISLGSRIVYSESDLEEWIASHPRRSSTSERDAADAASTP